MASPRRIGKGASRWRRRCGAGDLRTPSPRRPRLHEGRDRIERNVPCARADDLLSGATAPRRVGLIKIDVEGHEAAALSGARNTVLADRPAILIEAEERHGCDVEALFRQMEEDGYLGYLPWCDGARRTSADLFLSRQRAGSAGDPTYANNVLFHHQEIGPLL